MISSKEILVILPKSNRRVWEDLLAELALFYSLKEEEWEDEKKIYSFSSTEKLMNESYSLILDPSVDLVYKVLNLCRLNMHQAFFGFSSSYWLFWKTERIDLTKNVMTFGSSVISRIPLKETLPNICYLPLPSAHEKNMILSSMALIVEKTKNIFLKEKNFATLNDQEKSIFLCEKAEVSADKNNFEDSVVYFEWSLRFNYDSVRAYYGLGKIAFMSESFEDAKAFFEKAYTMDSSDQKIKKWYSRTLERLDHGGQGVG